MVEQAWMAAVGVAKGVLTHIGNAVADRFIKGRKEPPASASASAAGAAIAVAHTGTGDVNVQRIDADAAERAPSVLARCAWLVEDTARYLEGFASRLENPLGPGSVQDIANAVDSHMADLKALREQVWRFAPDCASEGSRT